MVGINAHTKEDGRMVVEIKTDRLIMKSYDDSELELSYTVYSDDRLTKYFDHGKPRTMQETKDLVSDIGHTHFNKGKTFGLYSIYIKDTNEFIGHADFMPYDGTYTPGISNPDGDDVGNYAEIGYIIKPGFHGKGYATEASKAFINLVKFSNRMHGLNLKGLMATAHPDNIPSWKVLEKMGFVLDKRESRFGSERVWYSLFVENFNA